MKALITLSLLFALTACNIDGYNLRKAKDFCADKGGIHTYQKAIDETVTCFNGDVKVIDSLLGSK